MDIVIELVSWAISSIITFFIILTGGLAWNPLVEDYHFSYLETTTIIGLGMTLLFILSLWIINLVGNPT